MTDGAFISVGFFPASTATDAWVIRDVKTHHVIAVVPWRPFRGESDQECRDRTLDVAEKICKAFGGEV